MCSSWSSGTVSRIHRELLVAVQQFSLKAKFNENRLKWKEIERSDSLKPENVLTSSLKMIKKALKKWAEPVFGNRNPSQPIVATISFVF